MTCAGCVRRREALRALGCRVGVLTYCGGCDRIVSRLHNRMRCQHPPISAAVMAEIEAAVERRHEGRHGG